MSVEHAKHNENVCCFLYKDGRFRDWVVTTAFYSALHYVRHKIFPLTKSFGSTSKSFINFDEYIKFIKSSTGRRADKHKELSKLVSEKTPKVQSYYSYLKDICFKARYHNYKVKPQKADKAIECLNKIKQYCC